MNKIFMFLYLQTVSFHLRVLCESDLRVSFALKKQLETQIKVSKVVNRHCHLCMEGHLELRLQYILANPVSYSIPVNYNFILQKLQFYKNQVFSRISCAVRLRTKD